MLVPDVFLTGESGAIGSRIRVKNDDTYFGYNTGYNRPCSRNAPRTC